MEFKIGERFKITSKPERWSSHFNKKNPLESDIKYPYYGKILDISKMDSWGYVAMTDGIYSWSLSNLIRDNKIVNITKQRKKKLKKLQNVNKENL